MTLTQAIEALLFSAQKPLTTRELRDALTGANVGDELGPNEFAQVKEAEIAAALEELKIQYIQQSRGFQLI
jgi:chromosome segregation and condensation protein ScpB